MKFDVVAGAEVLATTSDDVKNSKHDISIGLVYSIK